MPNRWETLIISERIVHIFYLPIFERIFFGLVSGNSHAKSIPSKPYFLTMS